MPGQTVDALVAASLTNAQINKQTWGGILYNVKAYGAKGDGLTDDTVAIQSAINAAAVNGGDTFFPSGTYVASGITLKSQVNLVGVKKVSALKLKNGSTSPLITGNNVSDFSITNLVLDGNKAGQTNASGLDVVSLSSCQNSIIASCEIKNGYSAHGIELINCHNIDILSNYIHDNGGNGVIYTNSHYLDIADNEIDHNGQRGISDYGTVTNGSYNIRIQNNQISYSTNEGVGFNFADSVNLTPCTIYANVENNQIFNNNEHGIVAKCNYSSIVGNQVIGNGNNSATQGIVVQANYTTIAGNLVDSNKGVGIDLGNCLRCVISGNLVTSNGCLGIEVNSTEDTSVVGNTVLFNNATNYGLANTAGIQVHTNNQTGWTGFSQNVTVTGNRVSTGTNQVYGIYVDSSSKYVVISDNAVKGGGNTADIRSDSPSVRDVGNITGASEPDIISLSSNYDMVVPLSVDFFEITGTTTINTIKFDGNILPAGKRITVMFNGALIVNNVTTANPNGNIRLSGGTTLTTTVGTILELVCDGTEWKEVCRSVK